MWDLWWGAGFLRVLRFPLPSFIPPIFPPSPIIWGWYNRLVVAAVPKVPPHKLKKKKGEKHNRLLKDVVQRRDYYGPPLIHAYVNFIQSESKLLSGFPWTRIFKRGAIK
jgi:hypothetical protein